MVLLPDDVRQTLRDATRQALQALDLTEAQYQTAYDQVPKIKQVCPRPVLGSSARLGKVHLMHLLGPHPTISFEAFCALYQMFVEDVVLTRLVKCPSPSRFFFEYLDIPVAEAQLFFNPPGGGVGGKTLAHHYVCLLVLAQAAAVAYGGAIVEDSMSAFVVEVEGKRFGIEKHRPAGWWPMKMHRSKLHRKALRMLWKGATPRNVEIELGDSLYQVVRALPPSPLQRSVLEAISILRWFGNPDDVHETLVAINFKATSPEARKRAVEEARRFEQFEAPYRSLHAILVPVCLQDRQFQEMFGRAAAGRRLTPAAVQRWRANIDRLDREAHAI